MNSPKKSPKKAPKYFTSKFQGPSSISASAHIQLHTTENPIPPNIRTLEPKGFIAPSWAFSSVLADVLIEYGYEYDSSPFPSWLMFPLAMRVWYAHRKMDRGSGLLTFENFKYSLVGKRGPHLWPKTSNCQEGKEIKINKGKIVLLPVPSTQMRVACWHTLSFIFGKNVHQCILKNALEQTKFFYY